MPKFVPRQRKKKVLARQSQHSGSSGGAASDANVAEVLPAEKRERNEKKRALKEELVRESEGKMSRKKKKRLDKYIVCSTLPCLPIFC